MKTYVEYPHARCRAKGTRARSRSRTTSGCSTSANSFRSRGSSSRAHGELIVRRRVTSGVVLVSGSLIVEKALQMLEAGTCRGGE